MMKILRFVGVFAASLAVGLMAGAGIAVAFTDTTFADFFRKLFQMSLWEVVGVPVFSMVAAVVAYFICVIVHEAGHLVCGLLTGYGFVSFRIFSFTFIREAGRLRVKRFAIAGTGGQCLLSPPEVAAERVPTIWSNRGGVVANLLLLAVAVALLWVVDGALGRVFLVELILVDGILLLLNGVPLRLGGMSNDASNVIMLRRNLTAKRSLVAQLRSNALIQQGVRPKDMPDEIFDLPQAVDYSNPLEIAIPLMQASRLLDMGETEAAYERFSELMAHRDEILGLYVKEIACELAFAAMLTGRFEQARELLDKELMAYIEAYRRVMSSKERLLCAKALFLDSDRDEAIRIYSALRDRRGEYLLQGEVASDMALMEGMLGRGV